MDVAPEKSSRAPRRPSRSLELADAPPATRFTAREHAEEGSLRAELEASRRKGDLESERKVTIALARLLARRDRQRDEAASMALRAIRIRDDAELRREVAEWLESLGEPALAAAVLGPLVSGADTRLAVTLLARVATLYARAGDAEGAADVLEEAHALDGQAALPLELRATIGQWAPEVVAPAEAANAFAMAAERRASAGADPLEDLLRAFDADPAAALSANALADTLSARGKRLAADEIRREHGRALRSVDKSAAALVHRRRREEATEQGALARALGAALDEGHAAGSFEGIDIADLLARAQLTELSPAMLLDPAQLVAVVERAPSNVRPVLLSFAAELLVDRGNLAEARQLAERACDIEPNYPRSAVSLALARLGDRDAEAAMAVERAVRLVCVRGAYCRALSEIHGALGARDVAVAWAQHAVALRPGDAAALEQWFRCACEARDAARLGDAISWAVAQPQPSATLAPLVAEGLRVLVELDVDRAAVLARRALDIFGPHRVSLREAIVLVAESARDDGLHGGLLERFVSAGAKADERPALLARLSELRARLGDGDGEAIALVRAVREGLPVAEVSSKLAVMEGRVRTSDGLLATLELAARHAEVHGSKEDAALALRRWGSGLADLAGDVPAALQAWLSAARLMPRWGVAMVLGDLRTHCDREASLAALLTVVESTEDGRVAGALAEAAASLALALGQGARALALSRLALEKRPEHAGPLAIAEAAAVLDGRPADLSPVFESVARRARGKFGRRAAHLRAANYFAVHGLYFLALRHAGEGFAAVPSEWALAALATAGERAGDRAGVVRAVVGVAEAAKSKEARGAWLIRAADLAANDEEGARQRVDVLLRGSVASPDKATLQRLGEAVGSLLTVAPLERDALSLRVGNATRMLTARIEGPDGARVAIELARVALASFADAEGGAHALDRALGADADVDEYAELAPYVDLLAKASGKLLTRAVALVSQTYANVGEAALTLLSAIAERAQAPDARAVFDGWLEKKRTPARESFDLGAELNAADEEAAPAEAAHAAPVVDHGEPAAAETSVPAAGDGAPAPPEAAHAPAEPPPAETIASSDAAEAVASASPEGDDGATKEAAVADDAAAAPHDARPAFEAATEKMTDLEQQALIEGRDTALSPTSRADRLAAVASVREARGDLPGAADALIEAALLEPDSVDRWRAAWTVADTARSTENVVTALRQIEALVTGNERTRVLRQLARSLRDLERIGEAREVWERLLALLPDDEEADQSVELMLSESRDYERLAAHLSDRIQRLSRHDDQRDSVRAARLRRAAILEQRLDRAEDACRELESLLAEAPQNESALRYLADLYERRGEFDRAAQLLRKLTDLARGPQTRNDLGLRAAFALRDAGDLRSALGLVKTLLERDPDLDAMALRVEISRTLGDDAELGSALEGAAASGRHAPGVAAEMWVEAAQAAARAGDASLAFERARRAVTAAPASAEAQLFARGLEYRERGAGTSADAEMTLTELARVEGALEPDDTALAAFLRAEAYTVLGRDAESKAVLGEALAHGPHALVALGLAERFAASGAVPDALSMFETALTGDLYGFRSRGEVALVAGQLAASEGKPREALAFLEIASDEEATRGAALQRMVPIHLALGELASSRVALVELARRAPEDERAQVLAELARQLLRSNDPADVSEGERALEEALLSAAEGTELRRTLEEELEKARRRSHKPPPVESVESAEVAEGAGRVDQEASAVAQPVGMEDLIEPPSVHRPGSVPPAVKLAELEAQVREATSTEDRERALLRLAQAHVERGALAAAEGVLSEALATGSASAGDELANLLGAFGERTGDLVRVRSRLVDLLPGDVTRLEDLRAAALADANPTYARAVEHVQRAFDPGSGPLPPPPLVVQRTQQGVLPLLVRGPWNASVADAFALVWEHAAGVFARDLAHYSLSGVERVQPGPTSALSRLLEVSLRLLDAAPAQFYVKRSAESPVAQPLLLNQPAALVVGDVREESVPLRYALGQAIALAQPENILVSGLEEEAGRALWDGLVGAFAPTGSGTSLKAQSGKYAGALWERLPQRAQRRMQELLGAPSTLPTYEAVREMARQSARRVGTLLAGNVSVVLRAVCTERQLDIDTLLARGGLGALAEDPALADLLRLAATSAYADARWRPLSAGPRPSGHFPAAS